MEKPNYLSSCSFLFTVANRKKKKKKSKLSNKSKVISVKMITYQEIYFIKLDFPIFC